MGLGFNEVVDFLLGIKWDVDKLLMVGFNILL